MEYQVTHPQTIPALKLAGLDLAITAAIKAHEPVEPLPRHVLISPLAVLAVQNCNLLRPHHLLLQSHSAIFCSRFR